MSEDTLYEAALRETIAENARLRAVLSWYADFENWLEDAPGWRDEGGLARAALADPDKRTAAER